MSDELVNAVLILRAQQHWAEAVAECVTDEQEALRLVGMYEEDEWPSAMLDIGRALLATRHELTAERAARGRAEAERDALAEAWREYLSAEQIIEQAAFGDNYTDAARARARQQRAIGQARAALAALERGDGKEVSRG